MVAKPATRFNLYRYRVVEGANILTETTTFAGVEQLFDLIQQNHACAEVERVQYTDRVNTWRWRNGGWTANYSNMPASADDLARWRLKRWKGKQ
jgi:hypothetical protein